MTIEPSTPRLLSDGSNQHTSPSSVGIIDNHQLPSPDGTNGASGFQKMKRRKQDPKTGKGLRHFSMKVCEKVKLKGTTTYNEGKDHFDHV